MPPEHARQIEEEFGIRLPSRYLEYVRNFPHIIEEMAYDPERWREHIENGEFLADPDELIRLNREFRNWHCEDEDGATVDPAQYWAIGGNYGGNYYLVRLAGDDPIVYHYDHVHAVIASLCADLGDFPYYLLDLWADRL